MDKAASYMATVKRVSKVLKALIREVTEDDCFEAISDGDKVYQNLRTLQRELSQSVEGGRVLEESSIGSKRFKWSSVGVGLSPTKRIELIEHAILALESVNRDVAALRALPLRSRRSTSAFSGSIAQ